MMTSPTAPTTPKASVTRREYPDNGEEQGSGGTVSQGNSANGLHENVQGRQAVDDWEEHDLDGRVTPVPGSNSSSNRTNPSSSPPSSTVPPRSPSAEAAAPPTARPTPVTTVQPPAPASVGFATLQAEEQLKTALQSKDRIFVVMLSKEMEAFIARIHGGETPTEAQCLPHNVYAQTNLNVLGPSVKVQSQATSKFQRLLVYKAAEWYGIKAISGPDGMLFIGVMGTLDEKSTTLRLASLVPEREAVQQRFQIMQRNRTNSSRASSNMSDAQGEGGPTSRKTLEQREAEYALARERIFQGDEPSGEVDPQRGRKRPEVDELGSTAQRPYQRVPFEPVYASLYHPPKPDRQAAYDPTYYNDGMQYGMYPGQYTDGYGMPQGMQHYPPQAYDANGQPIMLVPNGMGAYVPWQPPVPGVPPPSNGMMSPLNQWGYGNPAVQVPVPVSMPMSMPPGPSVAGSASASVSAQSQSQSSNGSVYSSPGSNYGGFHTQPQPQPQPQPQRLGSYPPPLQHPQPQRPPPQSHSSASSSISSRSYQDYSRPHSRGSTTSTRSATSSVRIGAMYPAHTHVHAHAHGHSHAQQHQQYRQKGIKGQVNGLTTLGISQDRRAARGHSPSSATTASSRSSRRTNSIAVQQPSHHPLPQRPDWIAGPAVPPPATSTASPGSVSEAGDFASVTSDPQPSIAGESDVEVPSISNDDGSTWSGGGGGGGGGGAESDGIRTADGTNGDGLPPSSVNKSSAALQGSIVTTGPDASTSLNPPTAPPTAPVFPPHSVVKHDDPDFPRRSSSRPAQILFDPSGRSTSNSNSNSRPASVAPGSSAGVNTHAIANANSNGIKADPNVTSTPSTSDMTPEDVIEAKLQALSVTAGVVIGPPPVRSAGVGGSYAKAVRRD